jgi:hemerythrin-like domain-containing protein
MSFEMGAEERNTNGDSKRRAADPANGQAKTPVVLQCLFEEHRHLAALVRALAKTAGKSEPLKIGDYYLLRDIAGYLHDYPDRVHHPTEEVLFEIVRRRKPAMKEAIRQMRVDHLALLQETEKLLELLDRAIEEPGNGPENTIRTVCSAFAGHQRKHMETENRILFPAAIESLRPADWREIEAQFSAADDPLFGRAVGSQHRTLYEYLIAPADCASARPGALRIRSFERLVRTSGVIMNGADAHCSRLRELGDTLAAETRSAVKQALRPGNLVAATTLPLGYGAFLGSAVLQCSRDLLEIWSTTATEAVAPYLPGRFRPSDPRES